MKHEHFDRVEELTQEQRAELAYIQSMPDSEIDLSDIPEITDWSEAVRGALYRPVKKPITFRIDADVLAWFKSNAHGRGYQTKMNQILRKYAMHEWERKTKKAV